MLDAADWQKLGIPTEHQWLNVLALVAAVANREPIGIRTLTKELDTSKHTVEDTARLARKAGILTTEGGRGKVNSWTIQWDRLITPVAGDLPKPSPNGQAASAKSAASTKKPTRRGNKIEWPKAIEWLSKRTPQELQAAPLDLRGDAKSEVPENALPKKGTWRSMVSKARKGTLPKLDAVN